MKSVWERVDHVLARDEPKIFASLRDAATTEQVEAAEAAMGLKFPEEIRAAYLRHDGAAAPDGSDGFNLATDSIFVWGNSWLSLAESVEVWMADAAATKRLSASNPDLFPSFEPYWKSLAIRPVPFNPSRIPIGKDSGPTRTYIDLAPCGCGTKGQLISDDNQESSALHAPSLDTYLRAFLDLVESGVIANYAGYGWFHCESKKRVFSLLPALRLGPGSLSSDLVRTVTPK